MSNEKINLAIQEDEKVVEIAIERLRDFKNHPFQVIEDEQMKDLMNLILIKRYVIQIWILKMLCGMV